MTDFLVNRYKATFSSKPEISCEQLTRVHNKMISSLLSIFSFHHLLMLWAVSTESGNNHGRAPAWPDLNLTFAFLYIIIQCSESLAPLVLIISSHEDEIILQINQVQLEISTALL